MTMGGAGLGPIGQPYAGGFSDFARTTDIVEDALVLAAATVRLKVKNRLVVRALRDGGSYDEEWLLMAASLEYSALASEKEGEVIRLDGQVQAAKAKHGQGEHPSDYRAIDVPTLKRRRKTVRHLARRLRAEADDVERLRSLISTSRQDALHDIAISLRGRPAGPSGHADHNALPAQDRAAALASLLLDLAELAPPGSNERPTAQRDRAS